MSCCFRLAVLGPLLVAASLRDACSTSETDQSSTWACSTGCAEASESVCCGRAQSFCLGDREHLHQPLERAEDTTFKFLLASSLSLVKQSAAAALEFSPLVQVGDELFASADASGYWKTSLVLQGADPSKVDALVFDTLQESIVALSTQSSPFRECVLDLECTSDQLDRLLEHLQQKEKPILIPTEETRDSGALMERALAQRVQTRRHDVRVPFVGELTPLGDQLLPTCAFLCPMQQDALSLLNEESEYHYKAMPGAMERSIWMTAVAIMVVLGSWKGTFKFSATG